MSRHPAKCWTTWRSAFRRIAREVLLTGNERLTDWCPDRPLGKPPARGPHETMMTLGGWVPARWPTTSTSPTLPTPRPCGWTGPARVPRRPGLRARQGTTEVASRDFEPPRHQRVERPRSGGSTRAGAEISRDRRSAPPCNSAAPPACPPSESNPAAIAPAACAAHQSSALTSPRSAGCVNRDARPGPDC